jgi:hypothetical protein
MPSLLRIAAVAAALSLPAISHAVVLTGTYTTGGTTTGTGPWNMTSTDSTFAVLRFVFDTPIAFQNITSLSYGYDSNLGGIGGGAPRAVFVLDNGNSFIVHWGPAGSFVNTTIGDNLNTGNLLGLNDVGRYDLGGIGGSAYTDRTAALGLAGSSNIVRISLILDSFGGNNRNFDINSVNVEGRASSVPDAGTTVLSFGSVLLALLGFHARSVRRTA